MHKYFVHLWKICTCGYQKEIAPLVSVTIIIIIIIIIIISSSSSSSSSSIGGGNGNYRGSDGSSDMLYILVSLHSQMDINTVYILPFWIYLRRLSIL
jgi:hypothetical protein